MTSHLLSTDFRPRERIVRIVELHFGIFGVDKRWSNNRLFFLRSC